MEDQERSILERKRKIQHAITCEFMCNVDGSFKRVGYVVKEARDAVYDALIRNDITVAGYNCFTGVEDLNLDAG